jgi:hypothetical protein
VSIRTYILELCGKGLFGVGCAHSTHAKQPSLA